MNQSVAFSLEAMEVIIQWVAMWVDAACPLKQSQKINQITSGLLTLDHAVMIQWNVYCSTRPNDWFENKKCKAFWYIGKWRCLSHQLIMFIILCLRSTFYRKMTKGKSWVVAQAWQMISFLLVKGTSANLQETYGKCIWRCCNGCTYIKCVLAPFVWRRPLQIIFK